VGGSWLVGATHRGGVVEHGFHGWLGAVRIVDRPLATSQFLA
jgi:hypothetical protein